MKIVKKLVLAFLITLTISTIGGYVYFNKKFSPPENYLTVSRYAENIPIKWVARHNNPHAALLLPVKIQGIDNEFYMQLDFGSPVTMFYTDPLQSISEKFPKSNLSKSNPAQIGLSFSIKDVSISSKNFRLLAYGSGIDFNSPNAENIIGTIGTDLLEKRIIILDFKNNLCAFVETTAETGFAAFQFKKRRILLPAKLNNQSLKLLFDSGTSGYELITSEEIWRKIRIPGKEIKKEKGNSWGKELQVISAPANQEIEIGNTHLVLSEVTHIKGTSSLQNLVMKSSGMQGMIGNKILLNHKIIIDCNKERFKIE